MLDEVALPSVDVTVPGKSSPFWRTEEVTYDGVHKRVTRMRGKASSRKCAEPTCDNQAVQWSYDGFCPAEKVDPRRRAPYCYHYADHYQARCMPCHRDWDRDQIIVADQP